MTAERAAGFKDYQKVLVIKVGNLVPTIIFEFLSYAVNRLSSTCLLRLWSSSKTAGAFLIFQILYYSFES
jgi:hypothetical protein